MNNRKSLIADWTVVIFPVITIALLIFLVGCSTLPTIRPADLPAFVQTGPTVVMFTKPLCPPCDIQEIILVDLAKDFPSIKFGKAYAYDAFIQPTDLWMVTTYDLKWTPTVVFQVDGQEACRWITLHSRDQLWPVLRAFTTGYLEMGPDGLFQVSPAAGEEK